MIITVTPNTLLEFQIEATDNRAEEARVKHIPHVIGGKGINVARMLKNLGEKALALTLVGGPNGDKIIMTLEKEGILTKYVKTQSETRVGVSLLENEGGAHRWWLEEGQELQENEIAQFIKLLEKEMGQNKRLALSGSIPGKLNQDLYLKILKKISAQDLEIFVDACGEPLKKACLMGGFFLKHNRSETQMTFGLDPFTKEDLQPYLIKLKSFDIWGCLITDGAKDAFLWDGKKLYSLKPPLVKKVSIVGCGDATLAGLIHGKNLGYGLVDAARWGLACGSADAGYHGPCKAQKKDVEALVDKVSVKEII
jgi:1-phosphofructokinase family hexose kinase